jgi:hypothetical protein
LEEFAEVFERKDEVFNILEMASNKFIKLKLKKKSYWYNKANSFSLMCLFIKNWERIELIDEKVIKLKLEQFEENIPSDYQIAAKEGVNNKQERLIRNRHLVNLILEQ